MNIDYRVDDEMLGHLDALEKHPTHYTRTPESFTMIGQSEEKVEANIYIFKDFKPELMDLPFHTKYSSETNGKKYVTHAERTSNYDYLPDVRQSS